MIAANELRIGNLVNGGYDRLVEVQSICSLDGDIFNDQTGEIPLDSIEGIELTEDWLLKFEFEKIGYNHQLNNFILWYNIPFESYFFRYESAMKQCIQIKSVHQLQNLYFTLTGKELILNE